MTPRTNAGTPGGGSRGAAPASPDHCRVDVDTGVTGHLRGEQRRLKARRPGGPDSDAHLYDTTAALARHMQAAMESRAVIGQAKSIIMGGRRCTAEEAFAVLSKESQDSNRKLRKVAIALVNRAAQPNTVQPTSCGRTATVVRGHPVAMNSETNTVVS